MYMYICRLHNNFIRTHTLSPFISFYLSLPLQQDKGDSAPAPVPRAKVDHKPQKM